MVPTSESTCFGEVMNDIIHRKHIVKPQPMLAICIMFLKFSFSHYRVEVGSGPSLYWWSHWAILAGNRLVYLRDICYSEIPCVTLESHSLFCACLFFSPYSEGLREGRTDSAQGP
jgi:hypothetical protein